MPWLNAALFLLIAAAIPLGTLLGARLLRVKPKKVPPTRGDTYECGEEPEGPAWVRFHPRYYVVALVFVLFDVEAAFLLPWALEIRDLGGLAIADMAIFLGILTLGWVYALRKGALRWQ